MVGILGHRRHLYSTQKHVGMSMRLNRNPKEEMIIKHLRIRHAGLNLTLYRIGRLDFTPAAMHKKWYRRIKLEMQIEKKNI